MTRNVKKLRLLNNFTYSLVSPRAIEKLKLLRDVRIVHTVHEMGAGGLLRHCMCRAYVKSTVLEHNRSSSTFVFPILALFLD